MIPNILNDDCSAFRVGNWTDEDGETGGQYAIFTREQAKRILGVEPTDVRCQDTAARDLTGWTSFWCGAGRSFGSEPCVRVYKHAVLVYQRTGLDI